MRARSIRNLVFSLTLALTPTLATVGMIAASPSASAAHADEFDCDSSYLPCDGSNLDYLNGSVPYPAEAIGDPGDPSPFAPGTIGDVPFWEGLGDDGQPPGA